MNIYRLFLLPLMFILVLCSCDRKPKHAPVACLVVVDLTVKDREGTAVHKKILDSLNSFFKSTEEKVGELNRSGRAEDYDGDSVAFMSLVDGTNPSADEPVPYRLVANKTIVDREAFLKNLEQSKARLMSAIAKADTAKMAQSPYLIAIDEAKKHNFKRIHFIGDMRVYEGGVNFEGNKIDCEPLRQKVLEKIPAGSDIKISFDYVRKEMKNNVKDDEITRTNEEVAACWRSFARETATPCFLSPEL